MIITVMTVIGGLCRNRKRDIVFRQCPSSDGHFLAFNPKSASQGNQLDESCECGRFYFCDNFKLSIIAAIDESHSLYLLPLKVS